MGVQKKKADMRTCRPAIDQLGAVRRLTALHEAPARVPAIIIGSSACREHPATPLGAARAIKRRRRQCGRRVGLATLKQ
ncbi:UNVERIFIED_ORG: hypothetical protein ABIB63_003461 [Xanthomonas axonopodis]